MDDIKTLGEIVPEKLMRCFLGVKKDLAADHKDWTPKRRDRVARAICVKRTGLSFQKHSASVDSMFDVSFSESGEIKELSFTFSTPYEIVEAKKLKEIRPNYKINDPESAIVVGRSMYEVSSKNFNRYEEKEIKKAVKTMPGITCQVDHSESARDTFGIVQDAWWDPKTIPPETGYIAELEGSDPVTAKVKKGYLRGVSMRSGAKTVECSVCGETWNWGHEHFPGEKYDGKMCERIPRGIYYRHLGFTPIPAIEGADAHYIAANMSEAFDNAMAFVDYQSKHGMRKERDYAQLNIKTDFGENIMSESDSEVAKALREKEKAKYELAESQRQNEELSKQITQQGDILKENESLKSKAKARLVKEVIEKELALKKIEEKNVSDRTKELEAIDVLVLEAKLDVLKEWYSNLPPEEPISTPEAGSKSKNFGFGSNFQELDEQKRKQYLKEAKASKLAHGLFKRDPSVSAVSTLDEWDKTRQRWKTDLAELFRSVPNK